MDDSLHLPAFLVAIVEAAQDAIISSDAQETITTWNPAAERLLGYSAAEIIGRPYDMILSPGNESERQAFLTDVRNHGSSQRVEATLRHKDGTLIAVETSVTTIHDASGQLLGFASISRDITERKAVEVERAATHQNTREVLERITDGFFALDRTWRVTYINEAAGRLLVRSRDSYLGKNFWEEFPLVYETPVADAIHRAIADQQAVSVEFAYPRFNTWYETRLYPSVRGISVFFRDVTEQRQAVAAMAETVAQLQQANRDLEQLSAAKSDFVSTISHELRTPLTSIQGFSELIVTELDTLEEAKTFAQMINENAVRLARMIGDVLDLDALEAGMHEVQLGPVHLNQVIERVVERMQGIANSHHIVIDLTPDLPVLDGDADLLERVITNLLANAIKYSPAESTVTLATAMRGDGIELTVADHGLGVPPDQRERIFSRYGRIARPEQIGIEGSGLGLPIVRHILELHNGRVWVEDNTPAGSVFRVVLPAADGSP